MPLSTTNWFRYLSSRLFTQGCFKMLVVPGFIIGFFIAYFRLLNHPIFPATQMPLTALDRLISFQPAAMLPYVSLWPYVMLAPALLCDRREIFAYSAGVATITAAGLGAFLFWPTAIPPPGIDWTLHPSFQFLKHVDAAGNACPSLHAAFTAFSAVWLERILRQASAPAGLCLLNGAWAVAIIYSTLATKQHVAVDALAGAALGLAGSLAFRTVSLTRRRAFQPN